MRNFAEFVRLPLPSKKKVDLHHLLQNVTTLMQLKAGEKEIEFAFKLDETPITIYADEQQMEQVLINIVKNSIEAIEGKGTISFQTSTSPFQLIIADTGKGIDEETGEQIFSPFFSTKKDGQGVGLMLIRDILNNHNFKFSLKTIADGTTEFAINFN
jgi:signal transduction histidine kinase